MALADRLTRSLSRFDPSVNALHDGLNDRFAPLWWPLDPPEEDHPLAAPEHMLYAAHVGLALLAAALSPMPQRRIIGAIAIVGFASWAVFTGAWDRRAAAYAPSSEASSERRTR